MMLMGAAAGAFVVRPAYAALPKLEKKDTYKVGFAQTESNNPWRLAQTKSMQDEATKRGWQLVYTDAAGSAAKQVADVRSMIAQKVDVILLAPREEKPLIPAVMEAKKAGIPMFLIDRNVDQTLAKGGEDYVAFIGSDFTKEGMQAAEVLTAAVGGKAKIIELQGSTGLRQPMTAWPVSPPTLKIILEWKSSHRNPVTSPATRAGRYLKPCIRPIRRQPPCIPTMTK